MSIIKNIRGALRHKGKALAVASGATMLATWYGYAAAADPDKTPYDLSFWRAGASVVGTALSTWFIKRRSPAALLCADGIHPSRAGQELIYDAFCAAL